MYAVHLTPGAASFFEGADGPLQKKLDRCFLQLASEPRHHPNIKPLTGQYRGVLRYRVGDWRVLYQIREPSEVIVMDIAHRREVYE